MDPKFDPKLKTGFKKVDTKEFELPDTVFIRDIENTVFQGIILHCLSQIEGIALIEGNFIDNIFGSTDGITGIHAEQDSKNQSVAVKIELNVCYGVSIPEKAEEIQSTIAEEITRLTGLQVSTVHVVFKNIVSEDITKNMGHSLDNLLKQAPKKTKYDEEYSDNF